jgi:hypothetical protein
MAVDPEYRRLPDGDVQIACFALDNRVEEFVD